MITLWQQHKQGWLDVWSPCPSGGLLQEGAEPWKFFPVVWCEVGCITSRVPWILWLPARGSRAQAACVYRNQWLAGWVTPLPSTVSCPVAWLPWEGIGKGCWGLVLTVQHWICPLQTAALVNSEIWWLWALVMNPFSVVFGKEVYGSGTSLASAFIQPPAHTRNHKHW